MGNTAYVALSGFSFNGTDPLGYTVTDLKGHIFKTVNANSAPERDFSGCKLLHRGLLQTRSE